MPLVMVIAAKVRECFFSEEHLLPTQGVFFIFAEKRKGRMMSS